MTTTEVKDPLFGTKSAVMKPSGSRALKDATRVSLSITKETAKELYDTLGTLLDNERGVKLDIHVGTKEGEEYSFTSAFFFAKAIGEPAKGGARSTFKRKDTGAATAEAAAAEMKRL